MTNAALIIASLAGVLFIVAVWRGPSIPDRVIALDAFVSTIVISVTIASTVPSIGIVESTLLVVALGGFVGTAILARFLERRG